MQALLFQFFAYLGTYLKETNQLPVKQLSFIFIVDLFEDSLHLFMIVMLKSEQFSQSFTLTYIFHNIYDGQSAVLGTE